jgi:hypothetical protein
VQKQALPYRENGFVHNPHVVLLGAGASFAAAPNGDKNGKKIPLLKDLPEVLGLESALRTAGFPIPDPDFESTYTAICSDPAHADLKELIETGVYQYFSALEIPDEPTVYDLLILGLRQKDVIATFNWDPFLVQALIRNDAIKNGPMVLFLHGNVMVGHCIEHKKFGYPRELCSECNVPMAASQLLYPVGQKDYSKDKYIASQWELLKINLRHAYGFTIFGYSGPKTDQEARKMIAEQWCSSSLYKQSQLEIIDIADRDFLESNWSDVIYSHHYAIFGDWKRALFFKHPRRSTEALFDALLQQNPRSEQPFPETKSFEKIRQHLELLRDEEQRGDRSTGT